MRRVSAGLWISTTLIVAAASNQGLESPWRETHRIESSDGELAFGNSVALRDTRALIGARDDFAGPGAAYVFVSHQGVWIEEQKLTASDGQDDDRFGKAVALQGDCAVVGAYLADTDGNTHQGAVYVFERIDGRWIEKQRIAASDGAKQDLFGYALAMEGNTLMIAAPGADIDANLSQGAAYVFERIGNTWAEHQKIVIASGEQSDLLGLGGISLDGDTALIGANSATIDGSTNQGAAYVLERRNGSWVETARLTSSGGVPGDWFGWSVALHGGRAVIGTLAETVTVEDQGTAYVFDRVDGLWTETQRLVASDANEFAFFGKSVATYGSRVLVSGEFDTPGNPGQGAVYSFRWDGREWIEEQKITASDGEGLDQFGSAIDIDRDVPLIGAMSAGPSGAAYFFRRTPFFEDGFESGDTGAWSQTVP